MKKITLHILLLLPILTFGQWNQLGNDIDGQVANEQSGSFTSLNAEGTVLAISSPRAMVNGNMAGKVRVYDWSGSSWIQRGADLNGLNQGDVFGDSINISADGNTVAIGAPGFLNPNSPPGYTQIYEWNGSNWVQKGTDIIGENNGDTSGSSVSLSANGDIIAIGAGLNDGVNGSSSGHCRIYEWNGTSWIQKGSDIDGEASNDFFGNAVDISSNGNIVAIGGAGNDGSGSNFGHVRLYEWNGSSWVQKGTDIDGEALVAVFGTNLAIDANGSTFIASGHSGSNGSAGSIKIFTWDGSNWVQKGATLNGDTGSDFFGTSVDINADGSTIIAGAVTGGGANGYARVFKFTGNTWVQQGPDFIGEASGDQFGRSSSISDDGSIVAIGTQFNDGNGPNAGHVRVFNNPSLSVDEFTKTTISYYPNPTENLVHITASETIENITLLNLLGQKIQTITVNKNTLNLDLSNQPSGHYLAKVKSRKGIQTLKLIKI